MSFPDLSVATLYSKNLPAMWETWVQSLGWEDPLEEGMAAHSSILAWRILMGRVAWLAAVTIWSDLLEWVVVPFSRGSSQPRDQIQVSHIAGGFFTS